MSNTLITIITITTILILMFMVPSVFTANQNDKIAESATKALVEEFVNKEASQGKITSEDYNEFVQALDSTGNKFEIDMQVQVFGDNPGVKGSATTALNVIGENISHTEYNNTILGTLNSDGQYMLKKGDYFIVSVKNTNVTLGKQLQQFFYQIVGKRTATIDVNAAALVSVTGVK